MDSWLGFNSNNNTNTSNQPERTGTNDDSMPLDDDCLYLIFEHLDLSDLLNTVQVNARFRSIATFEFKRKYSHQRFCVENALKNRPKTFLERFIRDDDDENMGDNYTLDAQKPHHILFRDYKFLSSTLKHFGCVIKRFKLENQLQNDGVIESILQQLNKYSAPSLIELELYKIDIKWLKALNGPFPKLEEFNFHDSYNTLIGTKLSLVITKKFPNLRRFSLFSYNGLEPVVLNSDGCDTLVPIEYFPNLEYVSIGFKPVCQWKKNHRIDRFLKLNPQIRSLEMTGDADYIVKIHSIAPNLEKFTIEFGRGDGSIDIKEPIHFEHMKSLHVLGHDIDPLANITFSNLQELRIVYNPRAFNQWNEFIQNNPNVTRFEIDLDASFQQFDIEVLIRMILRLPLRITELTINYKASIRFDKEIIGGILNRRQNLIKFTYKTQDKIQREKELRIELESDWNITATHLSRRFP